jgi:hypothetical protein
MADPSCTYPRHADPSSTPQLVNWVFAILPGTETNAIESLDERRFEGRLARRMPKRWLPVVEGVVVEG